MLADPFEPTPKEPPVTTTDLSLGERVAHAVATYNLPEATTRLALSAAAARDVHLVGLSGKLASGKDTVAPLVMRMLGAQPVEHQSFATPLKDQGDQILATIREYAHLTRATTPLLLGQRVDLAQYLATMHSLPFEQAMDFFATGELCDAVIDDPDLCSRSRTPVVRAFLQHLGTDVRRVQDDLYWVKRATAPAVTAMAAGTSVYFTDTRFPNEADAVRALGGIVIRLDVTEDTQRERLFARDGIDLDPAATSHSSETALDDYDRFDARVSNDGSLEETLAAIAACLGLDCSVPVVAAA